MNLNKALKVKNVLVGEIAKLKELIHTHNIQCSKTAVIYDTQAIYTELTKKINDLVQIKSAIARANSEIYPKIFEIAELRGLIATLNETPTRDGEEYEGYRIHAASEPIKGSYSSRINKVTIDNTVAQLEARIQALQDDLDAFNYTTEIQ